MFQKQRILELKEAHQREIAALNGTIAEIKSAHAETVSRLVSEIERLRDDLDRTRLFLNPGLANVNTSRTQDTSGPPVPSNEPVSAYQRTLKREWEAQFTPQEIAAGLHLKEKPDGRPSERRVATSFSEPSQTA